MSEQGDWGALIINLDSRASKRLLLGGGFFTVARLLDPAPPVRR